MSSKTKTQRTKKRRKKADDTTTTNTSNTTNENEGWDITIMRKIFYAAQQVQKCQKCIQSLYKLIKESKYDEFYKEFCYDVKTTLKYDFDNPKIKNILDMIAAFMISVKNENLLKNKTSEDTFDEIGLELFGKDTFTIAQISKTYKNLLDDIMRDALIPYLSAVNASTRLNTLYLIKKLLHRAEDIEQEIFDRLQSALLDRIRDKVVNVRLFAAHTLYRFQSIDNKDDHVINALQFHLKNDPADSVRLACLNVIYPTNQILPDIILKTRDCNSKIRDTAFKKLSKNIDFKELTLSNRLTILNNGFKDRNANVIQTVKSSLIPHWIKCYDDDIIELLADLDSIDNVDVISKFLEIVFQYLFSIKIEKRTRLHMIVDKFYEEYLDEQSILNKKQLSPENCIFWRCLSSFLKKNEDELAKYQPDLENRLNLRKEINFLLDAIELDENEKNDNQTEQVLNSTNRPSTEGTSEATNEETNKTTSEAMNKTASEPMNETTVDESDEREQSACKKIKKEQDTLIDECMIDKEQLDEDNDLIKNPIDLVIPNLSNFIAFFKDFCMQVDQGDFESEDLIEYEFIFKEFCLYLDNYEIADDSQKQLVMSLAEEIILMKNLGNKFDEYIENLMKYLSKSVIKTDEELVSYTVEITNLVRETLENPFGNQNEEEMHEEADHKEIRRLELSLARETVKLHELKDKLDEALATKKYDFAHTYKLEIETVEGEMGNIKHELNRMQNISIMQETERPDQEPQIDIKDYPSEHVKILQIFGSCLRFGTFRHLTSMMNTRIEDYVIPGICSEDSKVRYHSLKALNYSIFLSSTLASKFFPLYHEICSKDNQSIQVCALKGFIDALIEHGVYILYPDVDDEQTSQQPLQQLESTGNQLDSNDEQGRKKSNANSLFTNTREYTRESSFLLNKSEITTPDTSLVEDELVHHTNNESDLDADADDDIEFNERQADLTLKSQIIDPNKTAQQIEKEDEVIKQLTKFLLKFVRSDVEDIKATAVMGICKLLLMGRIYSPLLLSELILLWYNSSTSQRIQHDIGTFLPIYCLAEATFNIQIPENFSGQYCLLECFMSTVENVYRLERGEQLEISIDLMRSNYYDSDIDVLNVIEFMLNLLEPSNHVKIVLEFCEKILDLLKVERDDEYELREPFITKYLIRSLTSFNLFKATEEQLDRLRFLVQEIQSQPRYGQLKKNLTTRVDKFKEKLNV